MGAQTGSSYHANKNIYVYIFIVIITVISGEPSRLSGAGGSEAADGSRALRLDPGFKPRLGTSYYLFKLNGINIGTGLISMQKEGDLYRMRYEAKTNEKVDHIYKARYQGEGIIEIDPLKPVRTKLHERVRSKSKDTTIYFEENGRVITTETKKEGGKKPRNKVRETHADGSLIDPLSAVFLLQGMDWGPGKEKILEVYTGKARYETRFTCVGEVGLETSGVKRTAWVIDQSSRNLDKKPEGKRDRKDPGLRIFVSAQGYPDVLKVETTRKIGHITLTLERFEPSPDHASRPGP